MNLPTESSTVPQALPERGQAGLRTFSVYRDEDVSGVSGTGVVVEGVVFSTGLTVIHWLTPPPRGSLNVFDSFEQFMAIHVGSHPENRSEIHWGDGEVWGPGDWKANPSPWVKDPQADWPAHLRDDAPYLVCDRCGRKTWAVDAGPRRECLMPQPNGTVCEGRFRSES